MPAFFSRLDEWKADNVPTYPGEKRHDKTPRGVTATRM